MWKFFFLARRGWKMIPRRHRRAALVLASAQARRHGPTVARAAGRAVRNARDARARLKTR